MSDELSIVNPADFNNALRLSNDPENPADVLDMLTCISLARTLVWELGPEGKRCSDAGRETSFVY